MSTNTIAIPVKGSDEEVIIDVNDLPDSALVLQILRLESAPINIWTRLALAYYHQNKEQDFKTVLEESLTGASLDYDRSDMDLMQASDSLAAYHHKKANNQKDRDKKKELLAKVSDLYSSGDRICMYETNHLVGKAFLCISQDNCGQAQALFEFALKESPNNIPALLGKACILCYKKEWGPALQLYQKVLRLNPNCPANVRLAIGICYHKLNKLTKARLAFQTALQLHPNCVNTMVVLAISDINDQTTESIKRGTHLLSKAYALDPTNSMVLNHLANHFFFKNEHQRVQYLASRAYQNTEIEAMRAESCYLLARTFHAQNNFDLAFHYYYQAKHLASESFALPLFGLGQLYIQKKDFESAIKCFEKVLKSHPKDCDTLKVLSSLYLQTNRSEKVIEAKKLLIEVTKLVANDYETWVELAQILEQSDLKGSLNAYKKSIKILKAIGLEVRPEISNNIAAIHHRLGNRDKAFKYYSLALKKCENEIENTDECYFSLIAVTITYNLARLYEESRDSSKAEKLYKAILEEYPEYIDCYLRLGCMATDCGHIHEAMDWFKEVLQINENHTDAWILIGTLHLNKLEWGPARRKFERIRKQKGTTNDTYTWIAIGNVWLNIAQQSNQDSETRKKNLDEAIRFYKHVLKIDNRNIWAANGIGAAMALLGCVKEAKEIFYLIRETTADIAHVWTNLAHVYVHQTQYNNAIQFYKICLSRFHSHTNVDILLSMARAYFKSGQLSQAKNVLLRARRVRPFDTIIFFNLAIVLKELAVNTLKDQNCSLKDLTSASKELESVKRYFVFIKEEDKKKLGYWAGEEAVLCQDLMVQTNCLLTSKQQS